NSFELSKYSVPSFKVLEAYAQLYSTKGSFILSGNRFYVNGNLHTNDLNGHLSTSQGSYIVSNKDTTKLILFHSYVQFLGSGLSYSVYDIDEDKFEFKNRIIDNLASERLDIHLNNNDSMFFSLSNSEGYISVYVMDFKSLQAKKLIHQKNSVLPGNDNCCGKLKISNTAKYLAFSSIENSSVLIFKLFRNKICLLKSISARNPYDLVFTKNDKFLYFTEIGRSITRVSLSPDFEVEKVLLNTVGAGSIKRIKDDRLVFVSGNPGGDLNIVRNIEDDISNIKVDKYSLPFNVYHLSLPNDVTNGFQFQNDTTTSNCIAQDSNTGGMTQVIWIPNIFTPNYDGLNDDFSVVFNENIGAISQFRILIVNRLGAKVFESEDVNFSFVPEKLRPNIRSENNIYFYLIEFNVEGKKHAYKGNVISAY
ncbi:MAG: gliding motility-associated C-terminal domain-containing protein, partial [Bacteroidia bacterium]